MRKKLIYSLTLLFLLFAAGAGLTMVYMYRVTSNLQSVISLHRVEIVRQNLVINMQAVQSNLYAAGTPFGKDLEVIIDNVTSLDESVGGCRGCHHNEEMTARLKDVEDLVRRYKGAISSLLTVRAGRERVEKLKTAALGIGDTVLSKTREMAFIADKSLTLKTVKAMQEINHSKVILTVTVVLAFIIALIIAITLTKQVTEPVYALVDATRMIASGQLGYKTSYDDGTEFGELARNFNTMSERLKEEREQLVQSTKLAAIGELASNVAHEINNPLTSIIGFAEMLKDEEDLEVVRNRIGIIEKESLRAREIVRQLLQFARKRQLQLVEVDINEIVMEMVPLVEAQAKSNHVEVRPEFGGLPKTVGDPNHLKQVVINIINNAISAMHDGGKLVIRTRLLGEYVVIAFADSGPGIPKDLLPRIFEPFFTTKKDGGTGLGLSISYRIVQEHGGRIEVESKEGEGSTFTVRLPIKVPTPNAGT